MAFQIGTLPTLFTVLRSLLFSTVFIVSFTVEAVTYTVTPVGVAPAPESAWGAGRPAVAIKPLGGDHLFHSKLVADGGDFSPIMGTFKLRSGLILDPYEEQQVDAFPATVNVPVTQIETTVEWVNLKILNTALWRQNHEPAWFYQHDPSPYSRPWSRVEWNIPAFSAVLDDPGISSGECKLVSGTLTTPLNLIFSMPAGVSATIRNSWPATDSPPSGPFPPGISLMPPGGSTHIFRNVTPVSQPLEPIERAKFRICRESSDPITGHIDFELVFQPTAILTIHDPDTHWSYQGRWNILAQEDSSALTGFSGTMQAEEVSNLFAGNIVNVNSPLPSPLVPAIQFHADNDSQTDRTGWLEIEFSGLTGGSPMAQFKLDFVVQGIATPQLFPNPFALVLGQLRLNYGGTTNTSIKLPVYEAESGTVVDYQVFSIGSDELRYRVHLTEG